MLYQTPFDNAVWGKIFRRHLFDEIRMPVGMEYEDFAIVYKVFQLAGKVCYNPYQGYQYVLRQDGITLEEFSAKKMDLIELADQMKEDLMGDYPELRSAVWSRFFRANCHIYLQIPSGKQYQSERKRIEQNICLSRRYVLEDKEARRGTRGAALCTCLGFGFFRNLRKFKGAGKQ